MYGAVVVPGIHLLNPHDAQPLYLSFKSYGSTAKPAALQALTAEQRRETLSVITAGNAIILAGLGLIVVLQVAEYYVEKTYQARLVVGGEARVTAGDSKKVQ
jgi:hypothetical protein